MVDVDGEAADEEDGDDEEDSAAAVVPVTTLSPPAAAFDLLAAMLPANVSVRSAEGIEYWYVLVGDPSTRVCCAVKESNARGLLVSWYSSFVPLENM